MLEHVVIEECPYCKRSLKRRGFSHNKKLNHISTCRAKRLQKQRAEQNSHRQYESSRYT